MHTFRVSRHLPYAVAIGMVLAGCGTLQPPLGAPAADRSQSAQPLTSYKVIYNFHGKPDGANPAARLTPRHGVLYGTTSAGGKGCPASNGCGTVFKMRNGHETLLYHFKGMSDGFDPLAEVTLVGKDIYGTTYLGGVSCGITPIRNEGCGTVFVIKGTGERVLYRFEGKPDGARPQGSLIFANGVFYGTTTGGGVECNYNRAGCGTVYSIDRSGNEQVLHRFTGRPDDGETPTGNFVMVKGTLYGTTFGGGTNNSGTVFAISPSGSEHVLYSPSSPDDFGGPSGLIAIGSVLYGSSVGGGTHNAGTVYSVTTAGVEHILHNFGNHHDGYDPIGRLVGVNSTLYGTAGGGLEPYNQGIVYALNIVSEKFSVLYRFKGAPDGSSPEAGLVDALGTLYGTTFIGGSACHYKYCQPGYGTVFRFKI